MDESTHQFNDIRILYLCDREVYLHRTSRVRFHAVEAIARRCQVIWSGPGWENWNTELGVDDNITHLYKDNQKPSFIFSYKPYIIKDISRTKIPLCVSYNEMGTLEHPRSYTIREILDNHVDLVICHHDNEMHYPEFDNLPSTMVNISHCIEKTIFKDADLPKEIDLLLVGAIHPQLYPFRTRLYRLILKMRQSPRFQKYKIGMWKHPGHKTLQAFDNHQVIEYAQEINRAKICLTCSGCYRSRYAKYSEIPACRSLLMADLPDEDHAFFKQFTSIINMEDSDEEIEDKIQYYLEHDKERQAMTDLGYIQTHRLYTQENYAERFLSAVSNYLNENRGQKLNVWLR